MKIRNFAHTVAYTVTGLALTIVSSCDTVDKDDRLEYDPVQVESLPENGELADITEAKRCVLIEDFTGQLCVNCPDAADVIESLVERFSSLVIPVGIHPADNNLTISAESGGLSTSVGKEYYTAAGSPAMPAALINRVGSVITKDVYTTTVVDILQKENAPLYLRLTNSYDADTRKVSVEVQAKGFETVDGKLQLWLTEDGIIGLQRMQNGSYNMEYEHNHVFRAAINGTWGEDYHIDKDEIKSVVREATIDAAWNAENLSVVAFVYNDGGVQQVVKASVVIEQTETEDNAEDDIAE